MKKIITMLSLVVISIMFIVGCSDSKKSNELYIGNCPDNMMIGMGKKYFINNLEEGNYEIEFTAKEYDYGVLKKEHVLYKSTIEHSGNNNTFKIGVVDGDEPEHSLKTIINDAEYGGYILDYLKYGYDTGIAMSILDKDKYFDLDKQVAIAVYSIGEENRSTEGINIDEEFEIGNNNLKDLVVYVKLHKIK